MTMEARLGWVRNCNSGPRHVHEASVTQKAPLAAFSPESAAELCIYGLSEVEDKGVAR